MTFTTGRPITHTVQRLSNQVELEAKELNTPKGRHWLAMQNGRLVGEFVTWQKTVYIKTADVDNERYRSHMERTSWILTDPDVKDARRQVSDIVAIMEEIGEIKETSKVTGDPLDTERIRLLQDRLVPLIADRPHPERETYKAGGWKGAVAALAHPGIRRIG